MIAWGLLGPLLLCYFTCVRVFLNGSFRLQNSQDGSISWIFCNLLCKQRSNKARHMLIVSFSCSAWSSIVLNLQVCRASGKPNGPRRWMRMVCRQSRGCWHWHILPWIAFLPIPRSCFIPAILVLRYWLNIILDTTLGAALAAQIICCVQLCALLFRCWTDWEAKWRHDCGFRRSSLSTCCSECLRMPLTRSWKRVLRRNASAITTYCYHLPVVPHKAVAEVSII